MAVLTAADIADIAVSTINAQERFKISDIATEIQDYVAVRQLLRKQNVVMRSGANFDYDLLTDADDNARMVGIADVDNTGIKNVLKKGSIPWRLMTTSWGIDLNEIAMNAGDREQVQDVAKARQYANRIGWIQLLENEFWGEPDSSADALSLFGVRYWLVYNGSDGFTGGNNSNFSSGPGGVDTGTYARYKNYCATYVNVSKPDLIRKLRKAFTLCGFKGIPNPPIASYGPRRYGLYAPYTVVAACEELAEAQNDNLGNDLASKDGTTLFRRLPMEWVPQLDALTSSAPVVGIDWSVMKAGGLLGRWMVETPLAKAPNQHTVLVQHLDCTLNASCVDRRRCFLMALATWH